jgi:hypothetical protein
MSMPPGDAAEYAAPPGAHCIDSLRLDRKSVRSPGSKIVEMTIAWKLIGAYALNVS